MEEDEAALRIISSNKPIENAVETKATLEDLFLDYFDEMGKKTVKYEIKKIIVKPVNRIVLFITTMIVIVFALLAVNDVSYIKNDGTTVHGYSAAKELTEKRTNGREI